ncbi:nascent polypeptide-associated complex subunit alpha-like protein 2 [Tanacetum coccineum]
MAITQLEDIKKRIEAFKTFLPAKKNCNLTPPEAKKCCDQCQENLDDAIDGVKVSTESINKQDLAKANVDISGIATDIQTCNDCFVNGEDKDVRPFNWWAKGAIEECINSLKNAEIGVQKIGVRKSSVDQNNDGSKMTITQVEVIKERVETFKKYLEAKKNCGRTPPEAKKCCDQCQKNIDGAIEGVKVSMESINKQDLPKANNDISGIATDIETCNDCFIETGTGEDEHLKGYYSGVKEAIEECLNNLKNAEIGVQKSSVDQNNDDTKMTITQLEDIKQRIEAFKTYLPSKKNCNLTPPEAKKCCDQCQENLDDAIDGVKVSMESINKQDLPKANADISGIAKDIQTCNDCFVQTPKGEDKDVNSFYLGLKGVTEECLNNLKKAEIGVQKSSVDQNNDGTKMPITQVEVIKERVETFKKYLEAKKNCGLTPPEAKKCCDQCQKYIDGAIDGVKVSMESINKQDLPKANVDISGIAKDIETCNDCFIETGTGEDEHLKGYYSGVKESIEECLNNLKNAEIGVQKIGVQKSSVDKNNDDTKMTITQLEDIKQRLEAFKTYLPSKKNCNLTPPEAKKCCDQCQENLDDGIDGVKVSMESINKQDLPKANVDISGIATDIQTCNDCFVETPKGEDKDVNAFYLGIKGVTEECLQNLKKAEIGVQKSSVDQNNDGTKMTSTQLEGLEQRIEAFKTFLTSKKNCGLTPPEAKKCCDQCQENLDDAIDGVKVSMESINKQDLPKANADISGIAKDIQTCNDCFAEKGNGEDKDVKPFNLWVQGVTKECLDNLKKA